MTAAATSLAPEPITGLGRSLTPHFTELIAFEQYRCDHCQRVVRTRHGMKPILAHLRQCLRLFAE